MESLFPQSRQMYDYIYIGAGIINCLDACEKILSGNKVIIIEKSSEIGGAWRSINPFDGELVENAVHYLIPHSKGYEFIQKYLNIQLSLPAENKLFAVRCFNHPIRLPARSCINRIFYLSLEKDAKKRTIYLKLKKILNSIFNSSISKSRYPVLGSSAIISRVSTLLKKLRIPVVLNTHVQSIKINKESCVIEVGKHYYAAKNIVIGHGFIPPSEFIIHDEAYSVKLEKHLRPSLHIKQVLQSNSPDFEKHLDYSQVLFSSGSIIKYVHNLSKFNYSKKRNKIYELILVAALRHDAVNKKQTIDAILRELCIFQLISGKEVSQKDVSLFWQDIYLPFLSNVELDRIREAASGKITIFYTEELCGALARYSKNWIFLKSWLNSGKKV